MAELVWDSVGDRAYELGVDHGVLWVMNDDGTYENGVAWNGLTSVSDNPQGGDRNELWADNMLYASITATETAGGSISAYTYPDEFMECDGSAALADGINIGQQRRKKFAFSYQTREGNDVDDEASYKIHICYGCSCSPSSKDYNTINDSPDAIEFSWDYECTPVAVANHKPTATVVIDSSVVDDTKMGKIKKALYGDSNGSSTLLLPAQIITTMNAQ